MVLTAVLFILVNAVTLVTDRFALPPRVWVEYSPPRSLAKIVRDLLARGFIVALVFAIFFALSWRPFYAFTGTFSVLLIFSLISRAKFEFIREPLMFSDIALVLLVFRHKEMFYASWLNVAFWIFSFGYVFGASALFMIFEPTVLPGYDRVPLSMAALLSTAAPWLLLFHRGVREAVARGAVRLIDSQDIRIITTRWGALPSIIYPFLTWIAKRAAPKAREPIAGEVASTPAYRPEPEPGGGPPLLLVWQSESFIDMRHFGVRSLALPHLDRLRARSAEWGRMSSIFEGGYTLRTEFSVITGLKPDQLGPDAAYPYLRAATYADFAWPNRLRTAGWSTRFVHPYDRRFFSRDRALPLLGFEAMTMIDAFDHDRDNAGRYVSDLSLSQRVLGFCHQESQDSPGQMIFCASMENHGPWGPGRLPDLSDPLDIYLALLQRSDAALGMLADELDRLDRPIWMIFYGDHAPILKSFADPFSDPRTDYMILPLGRSRQHDAIGRQTGEKAPWDLIADTVARFGLHGLADLAGETPGRPREAP